MIWSCPIYANFSNDSSKMSWDQYSRRLITIFPSYAHHKPIVSNCKSSFLMIYMFTKLCNSPGIILTYKGPTNNQDILSIDVGVSYINLLISLVKQ